MTSRVLAVPAAFGVFWLACAVGAIADSRFSAADGSVTFNIPDGWKVGGDRLPLTITTPDGAGYSVRFSADQAPTGEPGNSAALRSAAEAMAARLFSSPAYAGVKAAKMGACSCAVFRFRGGGTAASELVEIWFAVTGNRVLILAPRRAGQREHSLELSAVFQSLSASTPRDPQSSVRPGAAANLPSRAGSAPQAADPGQTPGVTPSSSALPGTLMEGYGGRLRPNDVSFSLKLTNTNAATLDWTSSVGVSSQFSGTYSGENGNYLVNLTRTSGSNPNGGRNLTLYLRGLGGEESGEYSLDGSRARRAIAEIKLTDVYGGDFRKVGRGNGGARVSPNRSARRAGLRTRRRRLP